MSKKIFQQKERVLEEFFVRQLPTVGPIVSLLTKSTKIINTTTRIHYLISFGYEWIEDGGNLLALPIDMALFGHDSSS